MDISTIMLILNLAFFVVIILGFLLGLKGAKKSALSLAFFIGAILVTVLITPWITNALLQIQINYEGEMMAIKDIIVTFLQNNATVNELAGSGSNVEALILNMPQMIGNLVTYMLLLVIVGIIFWIAYKITAHFVFKKERQQEKELKAKNPLSKTAPNNVSGTGNITYVRTPTIKKHRIAGGFVGSLHALIFMIAFLVPVCGTASLINQYAYATEQPTTTAVVRTLDATHEPSSSTEEDTPAYAPSAKLFQENLPPMLLEIVNAVDTSIIGNICGIANTNNIWYNSVAKCNVNGKQIKLADEVNTIVVVYDNVEFLSTLDLKSVDSLKGINFDKLRLAVNKLTDSSILNSVAPELTSKYLKWITDEDISSLDPTVQDMVSPIREQLDQEPNLKELVKEIAKMFADEATTMDTIKAELLNLIDTAEIVINSDLVNEIVKDEMDLDNVVSILHAENNKLMNSLIDQLYKSDFVNLATLTALNYGIDAIQTEMDDMLKEDAVQIGKIVLASAVSNLDSSLLKSTSNFIFEFYLNTVDCNDITTYDDLINFVETYGVTTVNNASSVLNDLKNMNVLKQFNVLSGLVANFKQIVVETTENDDSTTTDHYLTEYVNLDCFLNDEYSFTSDCNYLSQLITNAKAITFVEGEGSSQKTVTLIAKIINGEEEIVDLLKSLTKDQLSSLITPASNITIIKPAVSKIIDELNKSISDAIGEVGEFLPADIDLADHVDEIVDIIDDAKEVLPIIDKIDAIDNDKSLAENLKEQLTDTEKDSVASLLNTLQENASEDGIFKESYNTIVETIKDDSKTGLDGLSAIVESHTTTDGDTTTIDWQAIIDEYLKTTA